MCGPVVPWDWLVVDVSYVLVLIGGGIVFRARSSSATTWVAFGGLSTFVGTCLIYYTIQAQAAFAAASTDAVTMLRAGC